MSDKKYDFCNIKAIIGLGNPGPKYNRTRHNIGFRAIDTFSQKFGASWSDSDLMQHSSILWSSQDSSITRPIHLIKPLTFMNNSGQVMPFLLKKGIKGEELLVVHDDLEKSFGKISIRWDGSARGHNGLRSIESFIGKDFWRLRLGIGRPEEKSQVSNYVLSPFGEEEENVMEKLLEEAIVLMEGV